MVEVANGFKMGVVKFIGETEFQPGEWIGVALERPNGKTVYIYSWLIGLHLCFPPYILLLYGLCRQTQWNSQRSEILQVQGETWSVC